MLIVAFHFSVCRGSICLSSRLLLDYVHANIVCAVGYCSLLFTLATALPAKSSG